MQIRHAQAKDAEAAGPLIFSSAENALARMFDVREQHHSLGFIQHAFTFSNGQFGYTNHRVIDVDGQAAAIVSAWHTELSDSFHQATLHSIASYFGLIDSLDVIHRCQFLQDIIPPPKKDEWCIGHFAVSPLHRRKGLGRKLLAHMQALAANNGKRKITLDVELGNQEAIKFYLDSGFVFAEKTTRRQSDVGDIPDHGHMFLPL
jgi:ribosomal protein S18 acetylase RimI-like enzyme